MTDVETSKVEEIVDEVQEETPTLEETQGTSSEVEGDPSRQNRTEKKIRKILAKSGLKPVEGILRIATKKDGKVYIRCYILNIKNHYRVLKGVQCM